MTCQISVAFEKKNNKMTGQMVKPTIYVLQLMEAISAPNKQNLKCLLISAASFFSSFHNNNKKTVPCTC